MNVSSARLAGAVIQLAGTWGRFCYGMQDECAVAKNPYPDELVSESLLSSLILWKPNLQHTFASTRLSVQVESCSAPIQEIDN